MKMIDKGKIIGPYLGALGHILESIQADCQQNVRNNSDRMGDFWQKLLKSQGCRIHWGQRIVSLAFTEDVPL